MNQHFRANAPLVRISDDAAIVPPELQIANNWIETVIVHGFSAFSLHAHGRRARLLDWSDNIAALGHDSLVIRKAIELQLEVGPSQGKLDLPVVFAPSARL